MNIWDGFWAIVILVGSMWAQSFLLRRSHAFANEDNMVRVSPMLMWMARLMVAAAIVIAVFGLLKYRGLNLVAPAALAGLFGFLGGALCYVGKTWFVAVADTTVHYNRGVGADRYFGFADITEHCFKTINGMAQLRVKTYHGWQVDIPIERLNAQHLLDWLAFQAEHGHLSTPDAWFLWSSQRPDLNNWHD